MSDSPAPLTLDLEEAIRLLAARDLWLERGSDTWEVVGTKRGYVFGDLFVSCFVRKPTWREAVSAVLGRPVVARDEVAELRLRFARALGMVNEDFGRVMDVATIDEMLEGIAQLQCRAHNELELRAENEKLRAAIREWVKADRAWRELYTTSRVAGVQTMPVDPYDRMLNAEVALHRLAGNEEGEQ